MFKLRDHETANTDIDRNTKGGLGSSHLSCVKFQPNTAMCKEWDGIWGVVGGAHFGVRKTPTKINKYVPP